MLTLPRRSILSSSPWLCRLAAGLLIFGVAVAHILYLFSANALDLAPDEAHYWDWSRHLDWSYYSKGPLVAYLIRGSCELFGPLSMQWAGNLMPAIRIPAVLCGSLLLVSVYVLTVQVVQREGLALCTVCVALTLPIITAGSTLMTIDSPYTCCWGWALVLCHHAIFSRSAWAWWATGIVVGVGILAKYTMVLFLPSVALFLLTTPAYRKQLYRPGFWIMSVLAALSSLPILIWNSQNHWVTFRHVQALGGGNDHNIYWLGPVVYVGGQFAPPARFLVRRLGLCPDRKESMERCRGGRPLSVVAFRPDVFLLPGVQPQNRRRRTQLARDRVYFRARPRRSLSGRAAEDSLSAGIAASSWGR